MTTAARVSATFAYVTPAARILQGGAFRRQYHMVDRGYCDNYGVVTLLEWLDQIMRSSDSKPSRVLSLDGRCAHMSRMSSAGPSAYFVARGGRDGRQIRR